MRTLWQDLRYGIRLLLKNPGFTLIAMITLGLGIGANTAIFSLVNTILLRPLPVERPEQVVAVNLTGRNGEMWSFSYLTYQDFRDRTDAFAGMAAHRPAPTSLSRDGNNERIWSYLVSGNYFDLLGVKPILGRTFSAEVEKAPNADPVVVLSYGCWQKRFGGDRNIVGQTITLNGRGFTVIGIAPEYFKGTELILETDLWVPSMMQDWIEPGNIGSLTNRDNGQWFVVGRIKSGITEAQALSSLSAVAAQIAREYPNNFEGVTANLSPPGLVVPQLRSAVVGFSGVLMGAVALVLLIACANLAGLLLARASARRKEIAVRLSLGATRSRIVRQLLTETVVLAMAGGGIGWLLAFWIVDLFASFKLPADVPIIFALKLDWRVLIFSMLLSLLTGVIFGLIPALQASKPDLVPSLKDEPGSYRRSRLRSGLVVTQVAISLVLLIAAGLVSRSLQRAQFIGPGFVTERALAMSFDLDLQGYDQAKGREFQQHVVERVSSLPGVKSASLTAYLPLSVIYNSRSILAEGTVPSSPASIPETMNGAVSPGYFATMGIPIIDGREFTEQDKRGATQVAIINETAARKLFPGQRAVGKRISFGNVGGPFFEVVGVAKDGKYWSFSEDPRMFTYQPLAQEYWGGVTLVVRTFAKPEAIAAAVRQEAGQLDPKLPVFGIRTLDQHMATSLFPFRVGAMVLGSFGLLALALAAIGIYGVLSYSIAQRTREIGIRMALGAERSDVLRLMLKQGIKLAVIGLAVGLAAAFPLTQLMASVLFGVNPTDPGTFTTIAFLLMGVAIAACYIPARRATKVDPIVALRCE